MAQYQTDYEGGMDAGDELALVELVLPLAKVKKLVKADPDIRAVSTEASYVIAKATELLIEHLAARSVVHTNKGQREEMNYKDVASSVREWRGCHDFLNDVVPMKTTLAQIQAQLIADAAAVKAKEELQAQQQAMVQQQAQQLAQQQAQLQLQQQLQQHQMQQQRQMQIQRQMQQIQQLQQNGFSYPPPNFLNHTLPPGQQQHMPPQQPQSFPNLQQPPFSHPQQQGFPHQQQHQLQQTLLLHTQMLQAQQAQAMQAQQHTQQHQPLLSQFGLLPLQLQHLHQQPSSSSSPSWPLPMAAPTSLSSLPLQAPSSSSWPLSNTAALTSLAQQLINSNSQTRPPGLSSLPLPSPSFLHLQPPAFLGARPQQPTILPQGHFNPDMSAAAAAANYLAQQGGGGFSAAAIAAAAGLMSHHAGGLNLAAMQGSMPAPGNSSDHLKQLQQQQQQQQQQQVPLVVPTLNL